MLGETISHYRILKKLGSGGMGVVYEAEDTTLGRKVALKFLPEETAKDAGMLARFQREARAASALNHPNICTIHAIEEDRGRFFIAMELLEGQTLDQLLLEKPLTNEQIIDLALQICDALEAAHSKGIVHRDIKPANIFVTGRNQVKVLDFGLAKLEALKATAAGGSSVTVPTSDFGLTRPGQAMGTIAYMSPEQARGEPLDARTDIFSFGAVLYQMATRKIPFDGNTSAVVFAKILEHPPVSPVRLNPGLHSQLEEIINKALEKDRDLRYQTATGMAADLRRLKRDTDSRRSAAVAGVAAVAGKKEKKSSWKMWAAIATVLLIAAVSGSLYWIRTKRASQAASAANVNLAILPLANVGDANNAYLSDGVTKDITAKLTQLPNLQIESLTQAPGAKGSAPQSGTRSVLSGSVVRSGDAVVVNTELVDAANNQPLWTHQYTANALQLQALEGQIATDIAERSGIKLGWDERQRLQAVQTANPEAYLLYLQARYDLGRQTPEGTKRAGDLLHQALQKDPNFTAAAEALAAVEKQAAQGITQAGKAVEPRTLSAQASPSPAKSAGRQAKHSSGMSAAVSSAPAPAPAVMPAPAAPISGMGTISVQSQPAGASIILDGKDTGKKTPAQVAAALGAHSIVLKQPGYADCTANANLKAGAETVTVFAALAKLGEAKEIKPISGFKKIFGSGSENMGRIRVETKPKGAKVTVGTQVVSKPTPVEFDLNPGSYQIKLELEGYAPLQKMVQINAGKRIQLEETLTKK
jgi:eukaryotic-like serine/threonine-protein kinase